MEDQLKKCVEDLKHIADANVATSIENEAVLYALRDVVIDLLAKVHGIPLDEAKAAFEAHRRKTHQKLLDQAEKISPNLAGNADRRRLDNVL